MCLRYLNRELDRSSDAYSTGSLAVRFSTRPLLAAGIASGFSVAVYLFAAHSLYRLGFPLDDAWIHQVYGRNLGVHGEWSFVAGEPSAGSTSPLWAGYLAFGYLLRLPRLLWAFLGGGVLLAVTGWLAARWMAERIPEQRGLLWIAALLVPLEWHLVWAALSGMESLAFGALAVWCCYLAERARSPGLLHGTLIGFGVWLRPEAVLLALVPVGSVLLEGGRARPGRLLRLALGMAVPLAGYLTFQRGLSGEWWPNTFFAKQAEYASLRAAPLIVRVLSQIGIPGEWLGAPALEAGGPLIGMLLALLPGLVISTVRRVRRRRWASLLPLGWSLLHLTSYALRLPVTYQHGRYAIPVIPVLIVLSAEGLLGWLDLADRRRLQWVLSRSWPATVALVALAFWGLGARAYARDVAIIESEMVETARWVERNTAPESVVAAHDIGALGYFAQRPLLDLAGLVSPEVIPIIRDEAALADYLNHNQAQYLMTFPGWYPALVGAGRLLYQSEAPFSPAAGGENMAVYQWNPSSFAP